MKESIDAPTFQYFLRKYEENENWLDQHKIRNSKKAYNYCRF